MTALLQSRMATAMMVRVFTAGGVVDLMPALAVMLGADFGSALNPVIAHRGADPVQFVRMWQRTGAEIDASSHQLDIVRDLKRIEAHIAATGHSLLELSGQLRPSRLQPGL